MFIKTVNMNTVQSCPDIGIYTININEGFTRDLDTKDVERNGGTPVVGALPPHLPTTHHRSRCRIRWTCWVNVPLTLLVVIALTLSELGLIPHHHGGFYCNDPSISHKFHGDTVSVPILLVGSALIPLFMILIVELILYRPEKLTFSNVRCKSALKNVYVWYGEYLLAFIFNLVFMDVMKSVVGEPRPHFLDTCAPDAAINCTTGTYISEYKCTNRAISKYYIRDSNKSFPSGHTSLSLYLAIFLFCYLQARACSLRPRLAGPALQVLVVSWSLLCSLTRISDHRHHWWDVLAGAVLATILAYYSVVVLCKHFVCDNPQLSRSTTSNGDSGRSLDNHNSVRRLISTSSIKQEDLDSDLPPVT